MFKDTSIMVQSLSIVLTGLGLINCILHSIGIYLMRCLQRQGQLRIHHVYLVSLSSSELLMNLLDVIKISISYYQYRSNTITQISYYIVLVQFTGAAIVFHFSMIFITVDRLLEILLNIKYPIYWNEDKAKRLLIALWIVSFIITIIVALCQKYFKLEWENYFFTYFFPIIEFFFIGIALATYLFIFKKFNTTRFPTFNLPVLRKTRIAPAMPSDDLAESSNGVAVSPPPEQFRKLRQRRSSIQVFRKSKFFIPVLLILTFLIFIVGADMIMLFVVVMGKNNAKWLSVTLQISYSISNLLDAWIYIFLEPELKSLLLRKIKAFFVWRI